MVVQHMAKLDNDFPLYSEVRFKILDIYATSKMCTIKTGEIYTQRVNLCQCMPPKYLN